MEPDQAWMEDDRDDDSEQAEEQQQQPFEVMQSELDDAYAQEYFGMFETNPEYDRNDYDASYKSIRAVRKYCRERGLPYTRHNGYQQPSRNVKDACSCRKYCYLKYPDDLRTKLLTNLLELSAEAQNTFLICHIEPVVARNPKQKQQQKSVRNYYLPSNAGRVRVCKLMFANTFDIGAKKVRVLNQKASSGAYDEWLRKLFPGQRDSSSILEESAKDTEAEEIEGSSIQNQDSIEHYGDNLLEGELDDDSDIELIPLDAKSEIAPAEPKPLMDDDFLDRYFHQQYEVDPTQEQPSSSKKRRCVAINDTPLEPCSCVAYHCTRWFTDDLRRKIYSRYARMSSAKQAQFMKDHTQRVLKKRAKKDVSRRQFSQLYFIPTAGGRSRVCKVMFLNTFKVSDYKVREMIKAKGLEGPPEEAKANSNEGSEDDAQRQTKSIFAFDPTLIDPFADTETPPRKKQKLCKVNRNSSSSEMDDTTKCKRRSETQITKYHSEDSRNSESDDNNDDPSSHIETTQPRLFRVPPKAELDDDFLDEYFSQYESSDDQPDGTRRIKKKMLSADDYATLPPSCTCRRHCSSAYPDEARFKIFFRFANLTALNQQRFLYRHVKVHKIQDAVTRRKKSWSYFLPSKVGLVQVCVVMFTNLFNVTDKKMRILVKRTFLKDFHPAESAQTERFDDQLAGCSNAGDPASEIFEDVADTGLEEEANILPPSSTTPTDFNQNEELNDLMTDNEAINCDEVEVKYSYELLNIQPQDEYDTSNAQISALGDSALTAVMESDELDPSLHEQLPIIPEIDEEFLDEYFIQFEIEDDQEGLPRKKIKPMTRIGAFDDQIVMEPCSCINYKCFTWLTDDVRQKIYSRFVRLLPLCQKRFVRRHVRREHKKSQRQKKPTRRNFTVFYFMPSKKGQIKVCKVMFMNTLKITDKKLRTLLDATMFETPTEESISDWTVVTGVDGGYLQTLPFNEEPQDTDEFNTDIKVEPAFFSNDSSTNECYEQPPPADPDGSTSYRSEDEETLSETETRPAVNFDDAFVDEYFAPYEAAIDASQTIRYARKKLVNANVDSSLLQPCACIRTCSFRYPDEMRIKIFNRFLKLPLFNQQRFLMHLIKVDRTRRSRVKDSRRQKSMAYYLPANPYPARVCKLLFVNTFQITDKKLRLLITRSLIAAETENNGQQELQEKMLNDYLNSTAVASDDEDGDEKDNADMTDLTQIPEVTDEPQSPYPGINSEHRKQHPTVVTAVELDIAFLNGYFQGLLSNAAVDEPKPGAWYHHNVSKVPNTLRPACSCLRQCFVKFPDHLRQMILDKYVEFPYKDRVHVIQSHIKVGLIKRRYMNCYYLPSNSGRVKVCKIMFLHTFHLTEKKLRRIRQKKYAEVGNTTSNEIEEALSSGSEYDASDDEVQDGPLMETEIENESEDLNEIIVGD